MVARLAKLKSAAPFMEPVMDAQVPGYSRVVSQPMDLSTVLARLTARSYAAPGRAGLLRSWGLGFRSTLLSSLAAVDCVHKLNAPVWTPGPAACSLTPQKLWAVPGRCCGTQCSS